MILPPEDTAEVLGALKIKKMRKEVNMRSRTKRIIIIMLSALLLNAVVGAVWLIAAGHAETAILTLIRWDEDGTLSSFENVMLNRVIPMVVGFAVAASALYVAVRKKFKGIDTAKEKIDEATTESVKTYGAHEDMNKKMEIFMEEERRKNEKERLERKKDFEKLAREQKASLAADRANIRRLEGKVDGLRAMEEAAHGGSSELVKKGVATRIAEIRKSTEGTEISSEEGGDGHEDGGDDGEAVEDAETV